MSRQFFPELSSTSYFISAKSGSAYVTRSSIRPARKVHKLLTIPRWQLDRSRVKLIGISVSPSSMFQLHGTDSTRRLVAWFTITTILPAVALGWVGWRMAIEDRTLQHQRTEEARDQAVELAVTALQRTVAELEERLADASGDARATPARFEDVASVVVFGPDGVRARGGVSLPYYPAIPAVEDTTSDRFARADALEFGQPDAAGALAALTPLASAPDPAVRAGALLRQARIARKIGQTERALAAYDSLMALDATRVDGWPAGLAGRQGRVLLLESLGRRDEFARDAKRLHAELQDGRWLLTRAQYDFSASQVHGWLGDSSPSAPPGDVVALAAAADAIWEQWRGRSCRPRSSDDARFGSAIARCSC